MCVWDDAQVDGGGLAVGQGAAPSRPYALYCSQGVSRRQRYVWGRSFPHVSVIHRYIAVDGTSLTVCDVDRAGNWFTFMLIPYTQKHIIVPKKAIGDR